MDMTYTINRNHLLIFLLVITGCVIACGCFSTNPPVENKTTAAAPATDAGILLITEEFPPFNYAGPDGQVTGQATDVVNGILTRLNQKATTEILPWSEGYNRALAGPRVALYSTGRTDEREHLFKWVGPIASFEYMLYKRSGSGLQIDSLEAAKKVGKIGVVKDDVRQQFLLENRFDNIVTCGSDAACLHDLLDGKTDLWLGSSASAPIIAQKEGIDSSAFEAVYPVRTVDMYIAFSNDTPDSAVADWQNALDAMKYDWTFGTILRNYGMDTGVTTVVPESAEAQADLAIYSMIAETDGLLKTILRTYEVLAVTPAVQSNNWEKVRPLLSTLEAREPDARTWYANPDGTYYTVVDGPATANLMSRSYFPGVLAGNASVGTVVVSHSTGKNTAIVAVPVTDNTGVTGVLGSSVYLDTLTGKLRNEVPALFVFYAIDRENKFALHSDKGQISRNLTTIGTSSSFGQAIQTIQAQESGDVTYEDAGVNYQARFRTSPLTGWRFVVAWPKKV